MTYSQQEHLLHSELGQNSKPSLRSPEQPFLTCWHRVHGAPQLVSPRAGELQPPQQLHLSQGKADPSRAGTETLSSPPAPPQLSTHLLPCGACRPPLAQAAAASKCTQELDSKPALHWHLLSTFFKAAWQQQWRSAGTQGLWPGSACRSCYKLPDQLDPARSSHSLPQPPLPKSSTRTP